MNRRGPWIVLLTLLPALLLLPGCGPSEEELAQQARDEKWVELVTLKQELEETRGQLAEARDRLAAEPGEIELAEGQSAEEAVAEVEGQVAQLEEEVAGKADRFMAELVNFINENPVVVGEEPTERQAAALRMKSDEDIELALEYVEKGGDYRRALDILERTEQADPDYPRLQEEIQTVRDYRYVTRERFDAVEEGMTREQVRGIMGTVYHGNVREYDDRGVVAWFYPKDPAAEGAGAAAAIYFRQQNGQWKVYQADWEAVSGREG